MYIFQYSISLLADVNSALAQPLPSGCLFSPWLCWAPLSPAAPGAAGSTKSWTFLAAAHHSFAEQCIGFAQERKQEAPPRAFHRK